MMVRNRHCIAFVLLAVTSVVSAQEPAKSGEPGKAVTGAKDKEARGKKWGSDSETRMERVVDVLNLSKTQQVKVAKVFEAYQARLDELKEAYGPSPEDKIRRKALRDALREAMEKGDERRKREVLTQIRAIRESREGRKQPAREMLEEAQAELHDGIAVLLRRGQKEDFEILWQVGFFQRGRWGGPGKDSRVLLVLVGRLTDLSVSQKQKVADLFKQFNAAEEKQKTTPTDPKASRQRLDKLYEDVLALLTKEQRAKIKRQLRGTSRKLNADG